jgi:hypothetical protein
MRVQIHLKVVRQLGYGTTNRRLLRDADRRRERQRNRCEGGIAGDVVAITVGVALGAFCSLGNVEMHKAIVAKALPARG